MSEVLDHWNALYAEVNGLRLFGQRGVRDPEYPCDAFVPGEPDGDCQTDGHYLCDECSRREIGCPVCSERATHCECPPCSRDRCYEPAVFVRVFPDSSARPGLCIDHAEALS